MFALLGRCFRATFRGPQEAVCLLGGRKLIWTHDHLRVHLLGARAGRLRVGAAAPQTVAGGLKHQRPLCVCVSGAPPADCPPASKPEQLAEASLAALIIVPAHRNEHATFVRAPLAPKRRPKDDLCTGSASRSASFICIRPNWRTGRAGRTRLTGLSGQQSALGPKLRRLRPSWPQFYICPTRQCPAKREREKETDRKRKVLRLGRKLGRFPVRVAALPPD